MMTPPSRIPPIQLGTADRARGGWTVPEPWATGFRFEKGAYVVVEIDGQPRMMRVAGTGRDLLLKEVPHDE